MSTAATPTVAPSAGLNLERRRDFPGWLPAMLVKELRQGLRTRGFVGTFVAFQVIMTMMTIFAIAGGTGSGTFSMLQGTYWAVLGAQLLLVTPARALAGLQAEIESRAVDLLLLTRLTAWRIVLGKWISLLAQAALLVVAMLPYGVARYFFGSVNLVNELEMIGGAFLASGVLTAAALWASALPKITRVVLAIGLVFLWQGIPMFSIMFMMPRGRGGMAFTAFSTAGASWLMLFNVTLVLAFCLIGAVRKLAPPAESQAPWLRLLPILACLPVPFLSTRETVAQLAAAGILFAIIAVIELARAEEPMAAHWRPWARRGLFGRVIGRFVQPGWASAMEWVLVAVVIVMLAGWLKEPDWKVLPLAILGAEALVFPALLMTWLSARFAQQRVAGYILIFGASSLIAAVGAATGTMGRVNDVAEFVLLLLPISSFWSTAGLNAPPGMAALVCQLIVALGVLALAWVRAKPYREQRRAFAAAEPVALPNPPPGA